MVEIIRPAVRPELLGSMLKGDPSKVAFSAPTGITVSTQVALTLRLASGVITTIASGTAVAMPALTAGTDYAIYALNDGTLVASDNFSAPTGYDATSSLKIGGFHYAPGGNAAAQAGGDTTPAINPYSFWDVKWRPVCSDPRGMALVAGGFWADIYLLGVNHHTDGTSKNNVTIADGSSPPKKPLAFGGNGTTAYTTLKQFEAAEVMRAYGKRLMNYGEFAAAAYGVTENVSRGRDPVTTGLGTTNAGSTNADQKFTSKWGLIQATGCLSVWGLDFSYRADGADVAAIEAFGWKDQTVSRGQIYAQGTYGLVAALFGSDWGLGAYSGSRASFWVSFPWSSADNIGARGCCDHLCHV